MKWSPDLLQYIKEVLLHYIKDFGELIGVKFKMPEKFIPTRWLSVLNCANNFFGKS